jgi:YgiT-type zinc finger domain-containing protein
MFTNKCKRCGGKVISANTNIEIETNGVLKTVTNVPGKKCSKCGHIIVDNITMDKVKQYAADYPANTIDYAMCEAEEMVVIQTLLL